LELVVHNCYKTPELERVNITYLCRAYSEVIDWTLCSR